MVFPGKIQTLNFLLVSENEEERKEKMRREETKEKGPRVGKKQKLHYTCLRQCSTQVHGESPEKFSSVNY